MFIHKVCSALNDAKVPYAIVGGYAVALYGVVRGTVDVDLVIGWSLKHLQNAEAALKKIGLVSRIPVNAGDLFRFREEYIKNRNLIAWNFFDLSNPINQVDIIINYTLNTRMHIRKMKTSIGAISVLSLDELIKMKRGSGRPQDLEDVKALLRIKETYE